MSGTSFVSFVDRPLAPFQLFCLPHAGAGSTAYAAWPKAMGPDVAVEAFAPQGRGLRGPASPAVDPAAIAAAVAELADRPFAVFGHSMGGLVAFEVVRELRRTGGPLPVELFVSGCAPPDLGASGALFDGSSALDDDALLARIVARGAIPEELVAESGLLRLLLPAFRTDFTWLDAYAYAEEPPLPLPITTFAGDDDREAPPDRMTGWQRHSSARVTAHTFAGDHFFAERYLPQLAGLIRSGLARAPLRATQ